MSTAALLGLESSKSYQSLNDITKSLNQLFQVRAKDQKNEESFYRESAKITKRQKADQERYADTRIESAKDYEKAIKGAGSEEGKNNALLVGGALLAAALLGTSGALKGAGNLFGKSSTFTKEFTESFEKETQKIEKKGGSQATTTTPTTTTTTTTPRTQSPKADPVYRRPSKKVSKYNGPKDKNYQAFAKIYNIAASQNAPYPELVAARAMFESGWLTSKLAKQGNNPFGQSGKGDAGYVDYNNASIVSSTTGWAKYSSFDEAVKAHIKRWASKTPQGQPGYGTYKTPSAGLTGTLENYAPAADANNHKHYTDGVNNIMRKYGFDPNKKNEVVKLRKGGGVDKKDNGPETEDRLAYSLRLNPQLSDIKVQKKQKGGKIFLHWTASGHDANFPQNYHTVFDGAGNAKRNQSYDTFKTPKGHTWGRNSQGVAMSLASMAGPNSDPWRKDPPTDKQIHGMAKEIALLAKKWKWTAQDITTANVMTHAEAARIDGYGPGSGDPQTRWDLLQLKKGEPDWSGGHKLRSLAKSYFQGTQGSIPEEASTEAPQPGAPGVVPLQEGREEVMDEQDRDQRTRRETTTTTKSSIAEEFAQFGEMGTAALEVFRGIQQSVGFNIFGDLDDKTVTEVDYLDTAQGNEADRIIPEIPAPEDTGIVGEEPQKQETQTEGKQKKKAKDVESVLKGLKKANHPDTGSGYQIAGMIDYKKRPVVLSQAAAYNLAKAISGGANFKGADVSSSQRSRSKNSAVGGHPNSTHLYGEGLDIIGESMRQLKIHGPKVGWKYGYNHGANSAHFNYTGPRKLQAGGIVGMQSGGSLAGHFNSQHNPSMIENKYSRPVVIVKRSQPPQLPQDGSSGVRDDGFTGNRMSNQTVSTSMYKVQMGALV